MTKNEQDPTGQKTSEGSSDPMPEISLEKFTHQSMLGQDTFTKGVHKTKGTVVTTQRKIEIIDGKPVAVLSQQEQKFSKT